MNKAEKKGAASPVPHKKVIGNEMGFPDAMSAIIAGQKVRRLEWADEDEYCLLRDNFLSIHRNGKFHSWTVSEGDMMGKDYVIVK